MAVVAGVFCAGFLIITTFLLYSMILEQILKQARLAHHSSLIPHHVTLEGKWLGKSQSSDMMLADRYEIFTRHLV